jgi:coatomer protein complex subunit alpha (xenin)
VLFALLDTLDFDVFLLDPFVHLTTKTNGLSDVAAEILETAGFDRDDVPTFGTSTLKPLFIVISMPNTNWPSVSARENVFDKALVNGTLDVPYVNGSMVPAQPLWVHS